MDRKPDPRKTRAPADGGGGRERRREDHERRRGAPPARPGLIAAACVWPTRWPERSARPGLVAAALALGAVAVACAGAPAARPEAAARSVWTGPLWRLAPAGASLVLVARPRLLLQAPAARHVIHAVVPDERFERYRQHTGIDPRTLDEFVWAETGLGTILAARGPFDAPMAVVEMGARMVPLEASADEPFLRRVGHYLGARRDLIAIGPDVLVAVTGAPSLARAVLDRAAGSRRSSSALDRDEIAALLAPHWSAPLWLVAPEPFTLPPSDVAILLARERALAAAVRPSGAAALDLAVDLVGEFPPGASENFRRLVESLAQSDLGAAVGMRDALASLSVESDGRRVALRSTVPAAVLASGLRLLLHADIAELLAGPDASP